MRKTVRKPSRKQLGWGLTILVVLLVTLLVGDLVFLQQRVKRVEFATPQGSEQTNTWLFVASDSRLEAPKEKAYLNELQKQGERADILFLVKERGDHTDYVNLSRDLLVNYLGHRERLSVMLYLGPDWLARSLCNDYQIPVNHVVIVTMQTIISVVDSLGGISVNIPYPFRDQLASANFPAGPQVLNGRQVLAYVRSRHAEVFHQGKWQEIDQVAGANQRMDHAQEIMQKIITKIKDTKNPVTWQKLAQATARNVRIDQNASSWELLRLLRKPRKFHQVETKILSADGLQRDLTPAGKEKLRELGMSQKCQMNPGTGSSGTVK